MAGLDDVIGHERVLARLVRAAEADVLTHAILFTGPESVGKTAAALALAARLLDADQWPGGPSAHPDLWVEDSDVENISIERVRAGGRDAPTLQDFMALRPYAGRRRVAVLGRAERLTEQAANSLLKTIEEPPPGTHLLLCAAHFERLPATVLSRCELVVLGPVATPVIAAWLNQAHSVPGADGRERGLVTLAAWASFVRDAACYASGAPELALWSAYRPALERWAEELPAARIVAILNRIVQASEAVATYAQPRLAC